MGGIQARAGSVAEVHAVRGGQLILRVSPSQTSKHCNEVIKKSKRHNTNRCLTLLGVIGNSWEEVEHVEKKTIKVYHGHCYLLDQSMDILEKIFLWLSPRDLALLCLTSKSLHRLVMLFIEHQLSSHGLTEKMAVFFTANEQLLLPKEIVLRDRIASNAQPQLLLYSAMRQFLGPVRRVSLAEEFSRQNASQANDIVREKDVSLKRDVIIFKRSCHSLQFVHTFKNIPPGKYTVQMRMRIIGGSQPPTLSNSEFRRAAIGRKSTGRIRVCKITKSCQYNSSSSTLSSTVSENDQAGASPPKNFNNVRPCTKNDDSNNNKRNNNNCDLEADAESRPSTPPPSPLTKVEVEELMSQSIDVFWWCKIVEYVDYKSSLSHAEVIYDRDSDWFFLRLNSFNLSNESDIEFEFVDVIEDDADLAQSFWRHTMVWDFVELRQIVKAP